MLIKAVDEYNEAGYLIYSSNYIGAYVRGKTREEALSKFPNEIKQYCLWSGNTFDDSDVEVQIVQEQFSELQICDADSNVIFETEVQPLTVDEYMELKKLSLKSAENFLQLYNSIPEKDSTVLTPRNTFYGFIPITAREMYVHTKNVNNYYFGEINVAAVNEPDIYSCRRFAFDELEKQDGFLRNVVFDGSCNEKWSLRKVCRRFIWHDRIHAKAMYKMAIRLCGADHIDNPFEFKL